jgi:hypothetical protein
MKIVSFSILGVKGVKQKKVKNYYFISNQYWYNILKINEKSMNVTTFVLGITSIKSLTTFQSVPPSKSSSASKSRKVTSLSRLKFLAKIMFRLYITNIFKTKFPRKICPIIILSTI